MIHIPVLRAEVLEYLHPQPSQTFIDGTLGLGGHAKALLEASNPNGRLLGLDWDPEALKAARANLSDYHERIILEQSNYRHLPQIAADHGFLACNGILLDLGLGSWQLDDPDYGISFNSTADLDMRFEADGRSRSVKDIIKHSTPQELETLFRDYGDEPKSRLIAQAIVSSRRHRPIATVPELVAVIESVKPRIGKTHPATQVMQALRIAANLEFDNLAEVLSEIGDRFTQATVAVITFHSGEDRIVKTLFKTHPRFEVITKKPIVPSIAEVRANPRSRSAKLRVAKIMEK